MDDVIRMTPENLIQSAFGNALFKQVPTLVAICGTVTELRVWQKDNEVKIIYGDLEFDGYKIQFRCSPEVAPRQGDFVELFGSPTLSRRAMKEGRADLILSATSTITLSPPESRPLTGISSPDVVRMSLKAFLSVHDVSDLCVFCTETAEGDIRKALNEQGHPSLPLRFIRTKFSETGFRERIAEYRNDPRMKAVVVARGGGEGLDEVGGSVHAVNDLVELKRPIFTAMGHADNVMLIEKYASEHFPLPYAMGVEIASWLDDKNKADQQRQRIIRLSNENKRLGDDKDSLSSQLEDQRRSRRMYRGVSIVLALVLVIGALLVLGGEEGLLTRL
ncbi:hypothetical protein RYH70_16860 [Alloalcanivorax xenomutans]|uniref:hypothetical protein n=1 Tax=Alloalcanivorax xenomutans TaxID=1094342 RepID=UPI0029347D05|nr:hypothetical protein [Alloalcanivorax xenomutans]WOD27679.1 hypothetical protein RYH70_16860 [Alloalcanivorax xenomutans]